MNMKLKTTFTTLTIAVATSLIAGCGSSDHDDLPPSNPNPPVTQAKGKAVDFYLAGATVTFDDCTGKPTAQTDENGGFEYPDNCRDTGLTVTGGIDIGTDLPFSGTLKAPKSTTGTLNIASPLTTLITYAGGAGDSAAIAAKLGLSGKNLLTLDPMTDAAALKQTVVVQQFVDQIQKALVQLSTSATGSLTPEQAARAASAALAARLESAQSGTVDLTSNDFIQATVQSAVLEAEDDLDLPAGMDINKLAANTAALTAAVIQEKVAAVNTAMSNITIGANPQATLNALGDKLDTVKETATSAATANLISTLSTAIMSTTVSAADLEALGAAVAAGNLDNIKDALSEINESLPAGSKIPESIADDLQQVDLYQNYLQLVNLGLNGGAPYNIAAIEGSVVSGSELTTTGSLNNVQVKLNKVGSPFQGNFSEARVGLSYTINGSNTLDLIIDRMTMSFDNNGTLTAASVPVNASYSFRTTGASTLVGTSRNNLQADNLSVSNGAVSLPIDTFLSKLAATSNVPAAQIANYRPKSGDNVSIKVALGQTSDTTVRVGTGTGDTARAAASISISTNNSTTNPVTLAGQGVSAVISVK